jgi:hypothetical protein
MKAANINYIEKAKKLSFEEEERVLSRMAGKLPKRLQKEKLTKEEALAIQLELEDEQLHEWRGIMEGLKAKSQKAQMKAAEKLAAQEEKLAKKLASENAKLAKKEAVAEAKLAKKATAKPLKVREVSANKAPKSDGSVNHEPQQKQATTASTKAAVNKSDPS